MSSIESAPATIPATSEDTFTPALEPLPVGTLRCLPASSRKPASSAGASTGASPEDDTRFGSFTALSDVMCAGYHAAVGLSAVLGAKLLGPSASSP